MDLKAHYEELDKYHLRTTEWKLEPLQNPQHDFVSNLREGYLIDLEQRKRRGNMPGARHCDVIRKGVALDSIEKHINKLEKVVTDQKQQAEER